MTSLTKRKICITLFSLLFLFQNSALARELEPKLTNIIVTNTRDDLLIYLNVEGAFTEEMESAILSGVPTTFSFYITLNLVRDFWPDKEIADIKVTHTIKYDNLKKEFTVHRSWENGEPAVAQSFEEAQQVMTKINSLKVAPLSFLEKGGAYQILAKAELSKVTLPFYLHYVLFFVSQWDFETETATIDFIY